MLADLEDVKSIWDMFDNYFNSAFKVNFIAAHFKIRHSRDAALLMLPRIFAATPSEPRRLDAMQAAIVVVNSYCFNDQSLAKSLHATLALRMLKVSVARESLEDRYLARGYGGCDALRTQCPGRVSLYWDWSRTRTFVDSRDFHPKEAPNATFSDCTCGGFCEAVRNFLFVEYREALADIALDDVALGSKGRN